MVGKIFITRSGYDPERGRHVKDPYLGPGPTLGACRPDIRRRVSQGDHIFVVSGKLPDVQQFVMGGFEVDTKIDAIQAYTKLPQHRLRRLPDGQITGNIIVNANAERHLLDDHESFDSRVKNYILGKNLLALKTTEEITQGRAQTLEALQEILQKKGISPFALIGRWGMQLTEKQVLELRAWLDLMKRGTR